jgi:hypothetical protein
MRPHATVRLKVLAWLKGKSRICGCPAGVLQMDCGQRPLLWVLQVAGSNPAAPTTRLRFAIAGQKMADRKLRRSIWDAWTDPRRAAAGWCSPRLRYFLYLNELNFIRRP